MFIARHFYKYCVSGDIEKRWGKGDDYFIDIIAGYTVIEVLYPARKDMVKRSQGSWRG
jgi:hypothetical protein